MTASKKAKEKLDEAGKEIRDAVDSLRKEVTELANKCLIPRFSVMKNKKI